MPLSAIPQVHVGCSGWLYWHWHGGLYPAELPTASVVEFRHASWCNQTVFAVFRSAGIIFCSCSGPRLPDDLVKTADDIYFRLHGVKQWYRHDYSLPELKALAEKIRACGATQAWVYFNSDRDGYGIKNVRALRRLLSAKD